MRFAALLGCVTLVAVSGTALAQVTPEQQSAIRANCRSDFMSKCSGVSPGGREALVCLQKNVGTLSSACKAAVSVTIPKPEPAPAPRTEQAPHAPAPSTAAATPPASPAPSAAASPAPSVATPAAPAVAKPATPPKPVAAKPVATKPAAPKPAAAPAPARVQTATAPAAVPPPSTAPATTEMKHPVVDAAVLLRACKLDLFRHCSDVEVGDGRKLACLNENGPKLTVRCRTALKVTAPIR